MDHPVDEIVECVRGELVDLTTGCEQGDLVKLDDEKIYDEEITQKPQVCPCPLEPEIAVCPGVEPFPEPEIAVCPRVLDTSPPPHGEVEICPPGPEEPQICPPHVEPHLETCPPGPEPEPFLAVCPPGPDAGETFEIGKVVELDDNPESPMGGGIKEMDVREAELEDLKWLAVKEINNKSKDLLYRVPVAIQRARCQVVAGTLHLLDLHLAQSSVLRRHVEHEEIREAKVEPKSKGKHFTYAVKIYSCPWENILEVNIEDEQEH
ncbi:hypothetical protein L596_028565 [Steinernema carpocapsae]|uniref:Cystatin domain-containing protein n=1 Tax=Steinernema carpocapsae TaxID=34508 RepID=A0A4U5LYU4_STECR|nr:hypothetical protein L596_028565 [Steinernema carpocapsae]